ncbi:MAG: flippase-like domain-containing protein [Magnetococcus sp. DMHC-6]
MKQFFSIKFSSPVVRGIKSLAISALVFMVLVAVVGLDLESCRHYLEMLKLWHLFVLFMPIVVSNVLRAVRLRMMLLHPSLGVFRVIGISFLYQFYVNLVPFRAGEATLPILLKKEGIPMANTIAVFIVARLFDLLVSVSILLLAFYLFFKNLTPTLQSMWPLTHTLGLAILFGALVALVWRRFFVRIFIRLLQMPLLHLLPHREWIMGRLQVLDAGFASLRVYGISLFFLTFFIWLNTVIFQVVLFDLLTPMLSWQNVVISMGMVAFLNQIMIHGFAGIGTQETLFVIFLMAVGIQKSDALAMAIAIHAILIFFTLLLGLFGWWIYRRSSVVIQTE